MNKAKAFKLDRVGRKNASLLTAEKTQGDSKKTEDQDSVHELQV